MRINSLRYIFLTVSGILLVLMILLSRDAGISCDEMLHYGHSVEVYDYFATGGEDQSALNTPVSNLKYYGQSYDNLVTIITRWAGIEDIYTFRHLMSSLAGWLTVFITALFAVWLAGYGAGIIVLILFALSPTFLGHSWNNLKDIPFALAYISSIFFSLRLLFAGRKMHLPDVVATILSIAFAISIRAGGLLLICYLFLFLFISLASIFIKEGKVDLREAAWKLGVVILISGSAYFLGILLWPYALQDPVRNVFESYKVMAHFPGTFRQLFEGRNEWSDFMPWYYLSKSMLITIPLVVLAGLLAGISLIRSGKRVLYTLILFTVIFPLSFVIIEKSNLYSSWRQFLFLYPPIILLASAGITFLYSSFKNKYIRLLIAGLLLILSIHPLKFILKNHPYEYLYYNQLTGGLRGAYGSYETDYYFISQSEASEWLITYLKNKGVDTALVKATYSVDWQFRNEKGMSTSYMRNEEMSMYDWDYAIITNRYIPVNKLTEGSWPPSNTIHTIYAESVPICAVIERKTKADYRGYRALEAGNFQEAVELFRSAIRLNDEDEMIFYNFARALYSSGLVQEADSVLQEGLKLNPDFEPILMYLGNIARFQGRNEIAAGYYEKLIGINRKYFGAYVGLAKLTGGSDVMEARKILRTCLTLNPGYKPAIVALADTYRKTDPAVAEKYDELAETIK